VDRQKGVPGRGDVKLIPNSWFAIELATTTPVPEWENQELWVGQEENAAIDEQGSIDWVLKRSKSISPNKVAIKMLIRWKLLVVIHW
jgi:hypothetical protein